MINPAAKNLLLCVKKPLCTVLFVLPSLFSATSARRSGYPALLTENMFFIETLLIGISLSMDALAVSIALGAAERRNFTPWKIFITAFSFGMFQAIMPTLGWFGGTLLGEIVQRYGKIVACVLLAGLGAKMIYEACKHDEEKPVEGFNFTRLMVLSFATSIDALLVGVGYACLQRTGILLDVTIIGCTTFLISACGCLGGCAGGHHFGNKFEILGGAVLVLIGIKILFFG